MKRDIELMKKILLAIEASEEYMSFNSIDELAQSIEEENNKHFRYQISLLVDEKLFLTTEKTFGRGYSDYGFYQLTSKGCAVLDGIRTDKCYEAVKKFAAKASMEVTTGLILQFIRLQLGI